MIAKIVYKLGLKLLTETVVARVAVYTLRSLAQKSENKLDDKLVGTVADALGVE